MPPLLNTWPPLPPGVHVGRRRKPAAFPLGDSGCRLFGWGRQALRAGLPAVGLRPGDEVLVPAYHHGAEVEALVDAGLACRFYDATDSLAPAEEVLEGLTGERTRALYLVHYLGFPQDSARWRSWCDERGLLLVEDAAQAWLASTEDGPVGALADLAVFCLYKSVGLPEGAALAAASPPPDPGLDSRYGIGVLARRHAAWLAGRSSLAAAAMRAVVSRREPAPAKAEFALRPHADRPWRSIPALLPRFDLDAVAGRRRANYSQLLEALAGRVPPPFDRLPPGASPFAFPVRTTRKRSVIALLGEAGIRALDFWSFAHPSLPDQGYPEAAERRAEVVCLPCHQELRPRDVDRIAEGALAALRSAGA